MNWKEQLDKKLHELNLEKGGNDGKESIGTLSSDRVSSCGSNNSISSNKDTPSTCNSSSNRSGDLFCGRVSKEITNVKKGGSGMITVDGALKDLEVIEKEAGDSGSKAVVKALKVVVKFLSTMRSNQLLTEEDKNKIRAEKEARKEQK